MQLSLCFGFSFVRQHKTKKYKEEENSFFRDIIWESIGSRELVMIIAVK